MLGIKQHQLDLGKCSHSASGKNKYSYGGDSIVAEHVKPPHVTPGIPYERWLESPLHRLPDNAGKVVEDGKAEGYLYIINLYSVSFRS